ncbi:MAG TPA: cell division protein FtsZ, partial [Fibrobacteria bacterium]|nr:cell division protein FtsZ [Fibrobacteria bacterium]
SGLQGVEYIALNTDMMALQRSRAESRIQIGSKLTQGLGAGADPQKGMLSMQEDVEQLREMLEGADMVFIAAGMGGGTGTGAAPVVAELARSMGILTVAVVTRPFQWEGPVRDRNAHSGLEALRRAADTVIVVPNQKLLSVVEPGTPLRKAFTIADEILSSATRGISEIILGHGDIQVDFADVRTIMAQGGDALMGTGRASGENRARVAVERAIHSPLLDNVSISGATGVLVNITGGEDMSLDEVNEAMNYLYEAVGNESGANIIFGTVVNPGEHADMAVTVIATGFGVSTAPKTRAMNDMFRRPAPVAPVHVPAPAPVAAPIVAPASAPLFEAPAAPVAAAPLAPAPEAPEASLLPQVPEPRARLERADDKPAPLSAKVPFGGSRPAQRPLFASAPRPAPEEKPALQETGAGRSSGPSLFSGLFGGKADAEPDIDYETPAFLRNQAD